MSCGCPRYTCVSVGVNPCVATVIPIEATDGIYKIELDFAGATVILHAEVVDGDGAIVISEGMLNESYTYNMRIYNEDGDLFNNTCYTLKTKYVDDAQTIMSAGIYEGVYE